MPDGLPLRIWIYHISVDQIYLLYCNTLINFSQVIKELINEDDTLYAEA